MPLTEICQPEAASYAGPILRICVWGAECKKELLIHKFLATKNFLRFKGAVQNKRFLLLYPGTTKKVDE